MLKSVILGIFLLLQSTSALSLNLTKKQVDLIKLAAQYRAEQIDVTAKKNSIQENLNELRQQLEQVSVHTRALIESDISENEGLLEYFKLQETHIDALYQAETIKMKNTFSFEELAEIAENTLTRLEANLNTLSSEKLQQHLHMAWTTTYVMQTISDDHLASFGRRMSLDSAHAVLNSYRSIILVGSHLHKSTPNPDSTMQVEIDEAISLLDHDILQYDQVFVYSNFGFDFFLIQALKKGLRHLHLYRQVSRARALLSLSGKMHSNMRPLSSEMKLIEATQNCPEVLKKVFNYSTQIISETFKKHAKLAPLEKSKERKQSLSNASFQKLDKSHLRIDSSELQGPVYFSVQELHQRLREVSDFHLQLVHGLHEQHDSQRPSILALTAKLNRDRPAHIDEPTRPSHADKTWLALAKKQGVLHNYGEWQLWMRDDYYVELIAGHSESSFYKAIKKPSDTYDAMKDNIKGKALYVKDIRSFLNDRSEPSQANAPDNARIAWAKFVSEPARNWRTWIINLMLLDLIEDEVISWDEFFAFHPMQGGSFAKQGKNGGEKKPAEIEHHETQILVNWLRQYWPINEDRLSMIEVGDIHLEIPSYKHSLGENFYRTLIIELLSKRSLSHKKWTKLNSVPQVLLLDETPELFHPLRLLNAPIFKDKQLDYLKSEPFRASLKTKWQQYWKLKDQQKIVNSFEKHLDSLRQKYPKKTQDWLSQNFEGMSNKAHDRSDIEVLNQIKQDWSEENPEEFDLDFADNYTILDWFKKLYKNSSNSNGDTDSLASESLGSQTSSGSGESIVYEAIPTSSQSISVRQRFHEWILDGSEGDCAFIGLGVDRYEAMVALLEHAEDSYIRQLVADDIYSSFLTGDLPSEVGGIFKELREQYFIIEQIARIEPSFQSQLKDLIEKIRELCRSEAVYRLFVQNYLSAGNWLSYNRNGHGLMDAIAQIYGIHLRIWRENNQHNDQTPVPIAIIHEYLPIHATSTRTVNLIHTDDLTHFNRLEEIIPEPDLQTLVSLPTLTQLLAMMMITVHQHSK